MQLKLDKTITKNLHQGSDAFHYFMGIQGDVFRALENRCTQRIFLNGKPYFIKQHFGIGWKEIFKNIFQGKLPALSAHNELVAIEHLNSLAIPCTKIVGFGCRGINPASRQSFLLTEELPPFITLEDLTRNWRYQKPPFSFKVRLIQEVARIARLIHTSGLNHRDFYICHFLLDLLEYSQDQVKLYLIDLHRAQIRKRTPYRWVIKDLAGLYFSSKDSGLTLRDLCRFMRYYRQLSLRKLFKEERYFWEKVKKRGNQLYRKHQIQVNG